MRKIFKKNQLIITGLALMIAAAGYLSYSNTGLQASEMGTRSDARSRFGWPASAGSARYGSASQVVPFHDRDQRKVASTERSCSVSQSSVSDSSCSHIEPLLPLRLVFGE